MTKPVPRRVLIVDDDAASRGVAATILSDAGYYVAGLDRAAGIMDAIAAQQPDLLVLDLLMPGKSGVDVLAELAAGGSRLPVLVLTALPLRPADLYGHPVLAKPYELDALVRAVQALIGPAQ